MEVVASVVVDPVSYDLINRVFGNAEKPSDPVSWGVEHIVKLVDLLTGSLV
ncbi:MAG: hypothetical protein ABEK59_07390 [Halobacteria archaeon]